MEMKKATTAATFGAALATFGVAQELQADVVSLTFSPPTNPFFSSTSILLVEVGASFWQWNDSIGKTLTAGGLYGVDFASVSQMIDPATFVGTGGIYFSASATGVHYVAFSYGGNVGWFSFDAGGFGGDINYLEGQYGTMGETLHIPAPAGLALLALGAAGIRRKRSA
jgi:hypothetical protein